MANTNENNVNAVLTEEGMNTLINKFAKKTKEEIDTKVNTKLTNYYNKTEMDNNLGNYYKKAETYNRTEIDSKVSTTNNNFTNYYNKTQIDGKVSDINTTISGNKTATDKSIKAVSDNLTNNYYKKSDTYNKTGVNTAITDALASYYNKTEIDSKISDVNDTIDSNREEIDTNIQGISNNLSTNYYKKTDTYNRTEIDSKVKTINTTISGNKTATDSSIKSVSDNLTNNYYKKSESYNRTEIDSKVKTINDTISSNDEKYLLKSNNISEYKYSPNEYSGAGSELISLNGYIYYDEGEGCFRIDYSELSTTSMLHVYYDDNDSNFSISGVYQGNFILCDTEIYSNVNIFDKIMEFLRSFTNSELSEINTNKDLQKSKILEFRNVVENNLFHPNGAIYDDVNDYPFKQTSNRLSFNGIRRLANPYYINDFTFSSDSLGPNSYTINMLDSSPLTDKYGKKYLYSGADLNIDFGNIDLSNDLTKISDSARPCLTMDTCIIVKNNSDDGYARYYDKNYFGVNATNACNLGSTSHRWNNIYAVNGTIQTSDRNKKNSITPLDDEETKNLIMGLIPSHYKMNTGTRTHYGLIAQDVEELLDKLNISSTDFAGFIKSPKTITKYEDENGNKLKKPITEIVEGEYEYSLRYDEFISPMIKMIQMQQNTIETQQKKIDELESRLSKLESVINTTNNETE